MNGPRRICAKPSFQNLLYRANIGSQGNQAQRRSGQGGASTTARYACAPLVVEATGPSVARGGVVLPIDQGPPDNRAQRDVVLPLQQGRVVLELQQGPQGKRAQRRLGGVFPLQQGPKGRAYYRDFLVACQGRRKKDARRVSAAEKRYIKVIRLQSLLLRLEREIKFELC
ncbi:hypothetical protein PF011_g28581 [Phytophthora fragariae]|uniref:Uncharacterized protein n=1 Tax=Phytophthora fragariae TaxID=53985 RepID=A0A6A3H6R0_9STRA|nr:hypothetical protein PF011_g28581 [Phytophthora fragariae]